MNEIKLTEKDTTRFWSRINKCEPDECWEWITGIRSDGYGHFGISGKMLYAHRVAHTLANGPIPDGMQVNHTCDNRACCNPVHLYVGTHKDNMKDMTARGRHHCQRGIHNSSAKLTKEDVLTIFELRKQGIVHHKIAAMFGVCRSTVSHILTGRNWPHLKKQ